MTTRARPPKVPRPTPVPRVPGPLDRLAGAEAERWVATRALPDVTRVPGTSEVEVTFVFPEPAADRVLLWANRLTDETDVEATELRRVPGTHVWAATFRMPADWRASYSFMVVGPGEDPPWETYGDQVALRQVLDRGRPDPGNPATCLNRADVVQSVVSGPDAPAQPWWAERPGTPRGRLTPVDLDGAGGWVHEPAGVPTGTSLPVTVVLDGEVWAFGQQLPHQLDNLYAADGLAPRRTVFVASGGRDRRWEELGDADCGVRLVLDRVVPWARRHLTVPDGGRHVTVVGQSLGGMTALRVGLRAPEVVGRVASQSASLWQDDLDRELTALAARKAESDLRIHLAHGTQEWVLAAGHVSLARRLGEVGVRVTAVSHCGGHDYAWWRGAVPDALVALATE